MDQNEVRRRMTIISDVGPLDPEAQHCELDQLYFDVLTAIARGDCEDPVGVADTTLLAESLVPVKWFA